MKNGEIIWRNSDMNVKIQVVIESDNHDTAITEEIACIDTARGYHLKRWV